mgnify:CR=1 FL=1
MYLVANWKLYRPFDEGMTWSMQHRNQLHKLAQKSKLVICPTHEQLSSIGTILQDTDVLLGAQDCATQQQGSAVGTVSAYSLRELNCSHCIIGHSARERQCCESLADIAKKMTCLFEQQITPIVCIGEAPGSDWQSQLMTQCEAILELVRQQRQHHFIIAYEPMDAVDSQTAPDRKKISDIFTWLRQTFDRTGALNYDLLYGGNVNPLTIGALSDIPFLNGVLVGRASLEIDSITTLIQQLSPLRES